MSKRIPGADAEFNQQVKSIRENLHKEEHSKLLMDISNSGGFLTYDNMEEFKEVFGDDWIIWIKCYSGFRYCISVKDYFKIDRQEIKSLDDFSTNSIVDAYKEMMPDADSVDFSQYDFRQDIREVYIPANYYEYFCF